MADPRSALRHALQRVQPVLDNVIDVAGPEEFAGRTEQAAAVSPQRTPAPVLNVFLHWLPET
jgi:hypothetical protein